MIQLTALYGHPQDMVAFDRHYQEVHAPIAKRLPGLKGYTVCKPASLDPKETSPHYLIADLYFESMQDLLSALQSPEGQAAAQDIPTFATGGVTLIAGEVQVYAPINIG